MREQRETEACSCAGSRGQFPARATPVLVFEEKTNLSDLMPGCLLGPSSPTLPSWAAVETHIWRHRLSHCGTVTVAPLNDGLTPQGSQPHRDILHGHPPWRHSSPPSPLFSSNTPLLSHWVSEQKSSEKQASKAVASSPSAGPRCNSPSLFPKSWKVLA